MILWKKLQINGEINDTRTANLQQVSQEYKLVEARGASYNKAKG